MSAIDTQTQPTAKRIVFSRKAGRLIANITIIALWLWLYRAVFDYLAIIFSREDFRTNQIMLLGVIALIAGQVYKGHLRPRLDRSPHLFRPALVLALGGSVLFLLVERFLDINTLSASLFGLASYGLLGLWMTPRRWRQGLPAALLLIGALPFGEHMQTFIGYPMRIFTAAIVRDGLATVGVASIGIDTILILENGVSQVDLPCSGVKSLWTGMLFLIAATWLERRPLNLRWLLIALVFGGLLFGANLVRVGVLVSVGQVADWRLAAEMLHVPLGVLGFIAACAAAVVLLRLQKSQAPREFTIPKHRPQTGTAGIDTEQNEPVRFFHHTPVTSKLPRPFWLTPTLVLIILTLGLLYTARPHTGLTQSPRTWQFPAELATEPMPLKPDEIEWLTRDGAESAERLRFEWRATNGWQRVTGSMILITSTTWRAHHRPERCFEVYGLSIDDSRPHLAGPDFPLRLVSLGDGNGNRVLSASYWFQSAGRTTDDYGTRIWANLAPKPERWVLVSILFDGVHDPHTAHIQSFYDALHDTVARNLKGDAL
jgi:exosortase O